MAVLICKSYWACDFIVSLPTNQQKSNAALTLNFSKKVLVRPKPQMKEMTSVQKKKKKKFQKNKRFWTKLLKKSYFSIISCSIWSSSIALKRYANLEAYSPILSFFFFFFLYLPARFLSFIHIFLILFFTLLHH